MRRRLVGAVTLGLSLLAPARARAQTPVDPQVDRYQPVYHVLPLTLPAAIEEALANHPAIAAARLELVPVQSRRTRETYLAPPTLEAEIWQWPLISANPLNTNMYMFSIRQEFPGKGKRAERGLVIEKDIERAALTVLERTRELVTAVKQTYADLYVSRQAVAVQDESLELLRRTADLITARYGAGYGSQLDVLKAFAEIARRHSERLTLDERVQLTTVRLNSLLNRPPSTAVGELTTLTDQTPLPPAESLAQLALEQHTALRGARNDVSRSEAELAVATGAYRPDFMVGGGYQLMPRTAGAWTAMVGITWPTAPWSRGRLDAVTREKVAELSTARAKEHVAANAIVAAVHQASIRASTAQARAALLRTGVIPQAQQMLEAARVAYQSDRGDAAALIEHERLVLDLQLQYFHALADFHLARVDLEGAVGRDLPTTSAPAQAEAR